MKLNIESHEGHIYLACIEKDGVRNYVKNNDSQPRRFNSIDEIKMHFSQDKFDGVYLVQSIPYDEMVGLNSTGDNSAMPLHW